MRALASHNGLSSDKVSYNTRRVAKPEAEFLSVVRFHKGMIFFSSETEV
jgi:hypothetical protein